MTGESYTYTGSRISTDVKDKFGDVGGVQITDAMILRWINDGQRDIAKTSSFNQATARQDLIQGQAAYPFASFIDDVTGAAIRPMQYDSVVIAGTPARVIPYPEFQQRVQLPGYGAATSDPAVQQIFATTYGGQLIVWPTPTAGSVGGLQLYYVAYPKDLAAITDPLAVPDRFYNALQSYVFGQALQLDENWEAAKAVLGQSALDIQREGERENRSPNDFYPTVTDTESDNYQWSPDDVTWRWV